jgi:hypothetical protein
MEHVRGRLGAKANVGVGGQVGPGITGDRVGSAEVEPQNDSWRGLAWPLVRRTCPCCGGGPGA